MTKHDRSKHGQRSRDDGHAGLATFGREGERVFFPLRVLFGVALLDLFARELLPPPVIDLAEAVFDPHVELVRLGDDRGRITRALERARIEGDDLLIREPRRETARLTASFV